MVEAIVNLMIKQKTIMIATKQNMVKQAIGVENMKKKMKKYRMKVTYELIIDKIKIKNLNSNLHK